MNAKELFDIKLPAALVKHAAEAQTVNAKFQVNVVGAGEWFVDLTKSMPTCLPGNGPADCTITIAEKDFAELLKNPEANAMKMVLFGKLKVSGNQGLATKLRVVFALLK